MTRRFRPVADCLESRSMLTVGPLPIDTTLYPTGPVPTEPPVVQPIELPPIIPIPLPDAPSDPGLC